MRIETKADFACALERLRRRDSESLAAFILSLAQDVGPVGEQVRTFIVGDDVAESVESIRERIRNLRTPTECAHRHARGKEVGASLGYVLDSIETLVLPVDPKAAFRLLVAVFEADGLAIENCGDHDFEVSSAFERAAELMGEAGRGMLTDEVAAAVEALMADDGYGMGRVVAEAISNRGEDG